MLGSFTLCLAAALASTVVPPMMYPPVYNGSRHQLTVHVPVDTGEIRIDGILDEAAWQRAAVLTGFSMYQPVDGRPAPDSTDVMVWRSSTALYIGIRAYEPHAPVRATLADRDKIAADDHVEVFLDTFDDHRRAFDFAVNPLGVQSDGIRSEGSGAGLAGGVPGQTDLSPDFIFDSKGHLTSWGYEVEVRIPFTSLRYPSGHAARWGINVQRTVQHSGYVETWAPTHRATASFLSESGALVGMGGLERGRVLEINPEATARATGRPQSSYVGAAQNAGSTPPPPARAWQYVPAGQVGGNVKYDLTSALTLNGTVRPDFSQIEADATQIAADPRFAVFYPEKRPFFTDNLEQFDVPNQLIYTRKIVRPTVALKLTGTTEGTDVAALAAIDDPAASATGRNSPQFALVRVRRDLPLETTLGLDYAGRGDGPLQNQVVSADLHTVFATLYYAQFQAAYSQTDSSGVERGAPLWEGMVDRTGRSFGFHYAITGIAPNFRADAGFIPRTDVVHVQLSNRFTVYGGAGARLENYTARVHLIGNWGYQSFLAHDRALEEQTTVENVFTIRPGWLINIAPTLGTYGFSPSAYASYAILKQGPNGAMGDTVPFVVNGRRPAAVVSVTATTPQFQHLVGSFSTTIGNDVDFFETDDVRRRDYSALVDWTPTTQIRVHASYLASTLRRTRDGVAATSTSIPRVAAEYQVARPLYIRLVAQYEAQRHAALTDYASGAPLLTRSTSGYTLSTLQTSNTLRGDALIAYQPSPGSVVFLGYGNTLQEPTALAFTNLRRVQDGFFTKVSYVFR